MTTITQLVKSAWVIEYAQGNPDGGDLMAPPGVLDLVPEHLRSVASK